MVISLGQSKRIKHRYTAIDTKSILRTDESGLGVKFRDSKPRTIT